MYLGWVAVAILVFGTANVHALLDFSKEQPAALDLTPSALGPLEQVLAEQGVTRVYADYWIANPLTFDHDHGIVASPLDRGGLERDSRGRRPPHHACLARARD